MCVQCVCVYTHTERFICIQNYVFELLTDYISTSATGQMDCNILQLWRITITGCVQNGVLIVILLNTVHYTLYTAYCLKDVVQQ